MRLIDADALIEKLKRASIFEKITNAEDKNVFEIIDEQPTAYDVEKVERKIKELSIRTFGEIRTEDVLDIVRKGGI